MKKLIACLCLLLIGFAFQMPVFGSPPTRDVQFNTGFSQLQLAPLDFVTITTIQSISITAIPLMYQVRSVMPERTKLYCAPEAPDLYGESLQNISTPEIIFARLSPILRLTEHARSLVIKVTLPPNQDPYNLNVAFLL